MAYTLLTFVRQLMFKESSAIASVTEPVLVCEAPPAGDDEALMVTRSVADAKALRTETVVFEVRKANNEMNAFALGITVGRTENNDIHLDESTVSRFHAYFSRDLRTKEWRLVDADSSNGTWVGEQRLEAKTPVAVADGAMVRFGEVRAQFFQPASFIEYTRKKMQG